MLRTQGKQQTNELKILFNTTQFICLRQLLILQYHSNLGKYLAHKIARFTLPQFEHRDMTHTGTDAIAATALFAAAHAFITLRHYFISGEALFNLSIALRAVHSSIVRQRLKYGRVALTDWVSRTTLVFA